MKITQVKVRLFEMPMPKTFHPTWQPLPTTSARIHVVEVHTDEGIVGVGSGGPAATVSCGVASVAVSLIRLLASGLY